MTERKRAPKTREFNEALATNAARYGVSLGDADIEQFRVFYEHLDAWNPRLHLVAACSPSEFATRHVLESLTALPFLTHGSRVVDVGSGAGLPIIPCLIVRPDLQAVLVEASPKKAVFLREALRRVGRHEGAQVIAERFEDTLSPEADVVTCRALERFTELLPAMVEWASGVRTFLLFGGPALREKIESLSLAHHAVLMPDSENRFLFVVKHDEGCSTVGQK